MNTNANPSERPGMLSLDEALQRFVEGARAVAIQETETVSTIELDVVP